MKVAMQIGGLFVGLLVGFAAAIAAENRRGRVVQPWQVERGLGLPILAVVPRASRSNEQEMRA